MHSVKYNFASDDIEWMPFKPSASIGTEPDYAFNRTTALAHLLLNTVIIPCVTLSSERALYADSSKLTLCLPCPNVFTPESDDDREYVTFNDIELLYRLWQRDSQLGGYAFCVVKRKTLPCPVLMKTMMLCFDIDALLGGDEQALLHALRPGPTILL